MKKLLLILICLFVSFEVKSESDDLSGKKIVCENNYRIDGLQFLDDFRVKRTGISKSRGTSFSFIDNYRTTPVSITIGGMKIDRLTLKLGGTTECKLIEDNFDSHMQDRLDMIVNEIKSKQKI